VLAVVIVDHSSGSGWLGRTSTISGSPRWPPLTGSPAARRGKPLRASPYAARRGDGVTPSPGTSASRRSNVLLVRNCGRTGKAACVCPRAQELPCWAHEARAGTSRACRVRRLAAGRRRRAGSAGCATYFPTGEARDHNIGTSGFGASRPTCW